MTAFNLNDYLHDDNNLRAECLDRLRAARASGEYWRNAWAGVLPMRQVRAIRCADGLELSVQASSGHYCTPRQDLGPWTMVEVGFPSQRVEELMEYAEDPDKPTETVYGWVPVEVVEKIVNDHGGVIQRPPVLVRDDG